ncbi:uncharacterized protein LOC103710131 [Phoenix dactylifera]|uniref:Uncharacterized protein LOC103710131 n=1 Tax=Phoenix dactylifera TaxID=42345 RepID=A0A8B7C8F1_PHODC|nr:uncharacterized protein LOC103710131 [Phoenix dactylifera]
MGDSTAMTIEFLRARLLSERSISRTAKERADQLAKRVMELEEQLRIIMIQRKKAEKASEEVLAILEAQGIGDFSEVTDSSSDQDEVPGGLKVPDDTFKEDDTSTASKMEKSEVEDVLSGLELEVIPSQVGGISWKGRSNSPDSHEKQKAKQIRQRQRWRSFMSTAGSSPKYHLGKSCRKIKRKEIGLAARDDKDKHILNDTHEKTVVTWSYISHDQPHSRNEMENMFPDSSIPFLLNDKNEDTDAVGSGGGEEMERALEQQAQLIGQYQAEENAQTEWERTYNENKYVALGFCESGNQLQVTEHSVEPKDKDTEHVDEKPYYNEEAKPGVENFSTIKELKAEILSNVHILQISHYTDLEKTCGSQEATTAAFSDGFVNTDVIRAPNGSNTHICRDDFLHQQCDEVALGETARPSKGSTFTSAREKQKQELKYENSNSGASSNPNLFPPGHVILDIPSSGSPSSASSSSKISKWGSLDIQNASDMQLSLAPSSNFGGVLEALRHAKALLHQEFKKSSLSSQGTLVTAAPTDSNSWGDISGDALKIPIGSAGLFRLPTDSYPHAHFGGHEIHGSRLRLAATSPYVRYASNTNSDQYPFTSFREARSGVSVNNQTIDPYHLVAGVPAYSVFGLPYTDVKTEMPVDCRHPTERETWSNTISVTQTDVRYGIPADYQRSTGRQPLPNKISEPHTDARIRMPPEDQYLMRGLDITRRNMQML